MTGPTRKPRIKPMTPGIPHAARVRAHLAGVLVTAGLLGVAYKAWALQVDDGGRYRELAARQHETTVDIPAPRGEVLDVRGRPLAVTADADSVWANPREIHDVTEAAEKLGTLFEDATEGELEAKLSPAALEAKLASDRAFVWIDRHVPADVAKAVRDAKLPGVYVAREPRRWYPARTIAGTVVGRSDIDGNGLDGIELSMNKLLTGKRGAGHAVRDARGRRMFADGMEQPTPGATVKLTLDRSIQAISDAALFEAIERANAKSGTVVVLDVETSHVLAMSTYPIYDPNSVERVGDARNRPVTDVFEAGSVMKLFSIAAALDEGVVKADTWFDTQLGAMRIGYKTIRDTKHDTYLTVSGIMKRSSNVGTVKIAQRLGREKLYEGLQKFGFGAKTGIELPGEQRGTMRHGSKWREIEHATISFGYGLTVTPIQIAAATAAIGNDGLYTAPRIVESVVDPSGKVLYTPTPPQRQAIKPATARAMLPMLAAVFEGGKGGGTGGGIVVPGFFCGGKTGTAHKWDPVEKKYADKKYLSSFVGLAPIKDPKLAIVVLIDEPTGGDYYGGKVAGPVFAAVASETLRYLGVPGESLICPPPPPRIPGQLPPLVTPPKACIVPSPTPPKGMLARTLAPAGDDDEPVVFESPAMVDDALPPGAYTIPDFTGMTVKRAIDSAREQDVDIEVHGMGQVISQDPLPGSAIEKPRVILRFSDEATPRP